MNKYYAGIGSRRTPENILSDMIKIGYWLAKRDWTLRSGGADGADIAFEHGCDTIKGKKEIFYAHDAKGDNTAMEIAKSLHPAWNRCSTFARLLHTRNVYQILGKDLKTPVKIVICWTPDGCIRHEDKTRDTGGTGMAISVASTNNIQILNLQRKNHHEKIMNLLKQWQNEST